MGTLVEWTAMDLVLRHAPRATVAEQTDGLAARERRCSAAAGITWVQEAALSPDDVDVYLRAAAADRLAVRVEHRAARRAGPVAGAASRRSSRPGAQPPSRRSPGRCRPAP